MVEEKKKNAFQKLKEGLDDKEEQLAIISLFDLPYDLRLFLIYLFG